MKKGNKGILLAIEKAGSQQKLADMLKCTQPNIFYWLYSRCPAEKAIEIEKKLGIERHLIRPDLFKK